MSTKTIVFFTDEYKKLGLAIARAARASIGQIESGFYPDGERWFKIKKSLRQKNVTVIGGTGPAPQTLWDFLTLIFACKTAGAQKITAVIPYMSYARQDRLTLAGEVPLARLIARLIEAAGARKVIVLDPHSKAIKKFFNKPTNFITAIGPLADGIKKITRTQNLFIVAPDKGAKNRALYLKKILKAPRVITLEKKRLTPSQVAIKMRQNKVRGKNALIIDDLSSTGETLIAAAKILKSNGVKNIFLAVTHGVFSINPDKIISKAGARLFFVSNSIPKVRPTKKTRIVSVAKLLAAKL